MPEPEGDARGKCAHKRAPSPDELVAQFRDEYAKLGVDTSREMAKCKAWCAANRKQLSVRRFVNWLNRTAGDSVQGGQATGPVKRDDQFYRDAAARGELL